MMEVVVRQICTQVTIVCDGMVRIPSCEQCSVVAEEEKRASGRIMYGRYYAHEGGDRAVPVPWPLW
jgi:hypothetical protein